MRHGIVRRPWLLLARRSIPTPSLSLGFLTPGILPAGVTFSRASIGTYIDATGLVQTATTNAARWDYDPVTHALRGLRIEEARTNAVLQSGDFTSATWVKTSYTVSAGVPGPNGPTTGSGFISNAAGIGFASQNLNYTAGTAQTISCFVKAGSLSTVTLLMSGSGWADASLRSALFDLATGTVSSTSGSTAVASMQPFGNGWYRCQLTATPNQASASANTQFCRATANGDGTTVQYYIWGPQFEAGGYATTYIPTTTAAVTRAAEDCGMPTGAWFSSTASTLLVEYILRVAADTVNSHDACILNDGTYNNRMLLRGINSATGSAMVITSIAGATATLDTPGKLPLVGIPIRLAGSWDGTTVAMGNRGATNQIANGKPSAITALTIGSSFASGVNHLSGHIRRIQYWPRALSTQDLSGLTR